ncbi:MAG: FHA domain-containing protein [Lentisphaerae bacterium]|nr:FHA domain-containing protein [Lentisphaerota bacterium]
MMLSHESVFTDFTTANAAHLDIFCPGQSSYTHVLDGEIVSIGRSEECTLEIPLSNVSYEHAQIARKKEEYIIEDLNSTNGTFVNNVRVSRCILHNHDHIRIGAATIEFIQNRTRSKA